MESNRCLTVHWKDHNQQLAQGLWNLFSKEYMTDTNVSFNGDIIKVHNLLLTVFLPAFNKMSSNKPVKQMNLNYVANQKEDVQSLVEFIYTGKTTIAEDRIEYVRNLARDLDFKGFVNSIKDCKRSAMDRNVVDAHPCVDNDCESITGSAKLFEKDTSADVVKWEENNFEPLTGDTESVKCRVLLDKMDTSKPKVVSPACETTIVRKQIKRTSLRETTNNPCDSELTTSSKSTTRIRSLRLQDEKSTHDESKKQRESSIETSEQDEDSNECISTEDRKSSKRKCSDRSTVSLKCKHCEYITHSKSAFRRHVKRHEPETFKCGKCNKQFKLKRYLMFHNKTSCEKDFQSVCNYCGFRTLRQTTLREHLAAKHRVDIKGNHLEENVKCTKCDFVCFARHELRRHVLRKHTEKKYECPQCEFAAVVNSELQRHFRLCHLNERKYVCDVCGVSYQISTDLNKHIQTKHKGLKPYKCNECGKDFSDRSEYRRHMSKHNGTEKLYVCHVCGHSCNKRYNLGTHMKRHHGVTIERIKKDYAPRQNATTEVKNVSDNNPTMEEGTTSTSTATTSTSSATTSTSSATTSTSSATTSTSSATTSTTADNPFLNYTTW